jgi:hypothetical protein
MREREYVRHDDKAASRFPPKGRDGRFDLYVEMNRRNDRLDLERPGRRLKWGHINRYGEYVRIEHDSSPLEACGPCF